MEAVFDPLLLLLTYGKCSGHITKLTLELILKLLDHKSNDPRAPAARPDLAIEINEQLVNRICLMALNCQFADTDKHLEELILIRIQEVFLLCCKSSHLRSDLLFEIYEYLHRMCSIELRAA